jgi:hypothetical protein
MAPFSETRDERIGQFLRVHEHPVVGIEEQTLLRCEDGEYRVLGAGRVRLFRRGVAPRDFHAGDRVMW